MHVEGHVPGAASDGAGQIAVQGIDQTFLEPIQGGQIGVEGLACGLVRKAKGEAPEDGREGAASLACCVTVRNFAQEFEFPLLPAAPAALTLEAAAWLRALAVYRTTDDQASHLPDGFRSHISKSKTGKRFRHKRLAPYKRPCGSMAREF